MSILQAGRLENIDLRTYAWFAGNALLVLSSYPLIYIFEKTFGFISDATLLELSDTNQPLLRELSEKAPGTLQHSMQVANLAEEAILTIGGNSLLVRTGALYHDIGKMNDPMYFIENLTSNFNPHDNLEFEESATKIISHVSKGVEIARKNKLPDVIIDFIKTHHGTTMVLYFYRSFLKKYPDTEIDAAKFTYPGPKPFSKETAVLMMADSTEAASRSLKTINKEVINDLVENIIDHQVKANQFDNVDITLKDFALIKEVFKNKLINIYHARIEYPKEVTPKSPKGDFKSSD
jgi:putative nucleotidyltransferase with HDIG domain